MELYHLIYTSTPAKLLDDNEVHQLLETSREANSRFQVTGMLVCLPDSYIQLIEGPEVYITQLYQNIQQDQRHLRVTTLREGPIEKRFFPDWAMAFTKRTSGTAGENMVSLQDDKVLQLFDILEF